MAVARVRERLARVPMEKFNLKKLNEVEGKEQYCAEISNRLTALENLDAEGKLTERISRFLLKRV
jgi:hypothetical protein